MRKTLPCLFAAARLAAPGNAGAAEEEDDNSIEIPGFGGIPLPPALVREGASDRRDRAASPKAANSGNLQSGPGPIRRIPI
jgi:hypothetical protein